MSNPFEVLGLECRPRVDGARLRQAYFEASRRWHPDRHGGESAHFLRAREAYETLRNPAARLDALAALSAESGAPTPPDTIRGELFSVVAAAVQSAQEALAEGTPVSSPLLLALREMRRREALQKLGTALDTLESAEAAAQKDLGALDERWPRVTRAELEALASRFRFLARGRRELEEWLLKLRQLPAERMAHA